MATLQFQGITTSVDASFWQELSRRKLQLFMLDDSPKVCLDACPSPRHQRR
jgi:hypothetical protein